MDRSGPCYGPLVLQRIHNVPHHVSTIHIRLTHEQRDFLASQSVGFRRISDVVRDLIDAAMAQASESLDTACTLGARPEGELPSNSTSSVVIPTLYNPDIHKKLELSSKRKSRSTKTTAQPVENLATGTTPRRTYDDQFKAWWAQYQAISNRASSQSKPKAWDEWRKALRKVTIEDLRSCLTAAVQEQRMVERQGGFASSFPDAFRWLRDGRYEAFMPSDTSEPLDAPSRAFQGPLPSDPF